MPSSHIQGTISIDQFRCVAEPTMNVGTTPNDSATNPATLLPLLDRGSWSDILTVHNPTALYVDRFVSPVWYVIGICGNVLSVLVWAEKGTRHVNSSAVYLATLSVTDLVFLLLHIIMELKYAWGVDILSYPVFCETYFVFYLAVQYLSPVLVLGFTVERWIAVCRPFQKERYCTTSRAQKVVAGFVILCVSLCLMQAYFWTYVNGQCTLRQAALEGGDASLWSLWTWSTELLMFLVVPIVNLVFNVLVLCEIRRMSGDSLPGQAKQNAHARIVTTVTLLSVSFYVIFTTLPATLVYTLSQDFESANSTLTDAEALQDPEWQRYFKFITFRKVVEELCLSHYACNCILYALTGEHFRTRVWHILHGNRNETCTTYSQVSQRNDGFSIKLTDLTNTH